MRRDDLRVCAGLLLLLTVLTGQPLRGQGPLPGPIDPSTLAPPPAAVVSEDASSYDGGLGEKLPAEEGSFAKGLFFIGDYLLLKPRRDALDFAVLSSDTSAAPSGTVQSLDWQTRSGFRFGTGYQLPNEPWRISVDYTYLHSSDGRTVTSPPGGQLFATLTRGGGVDDVQSASATANIDYNVIDLDVTRLLAVSPSLDVQLFGGGRFAWIDQKFSAIYNGGTLGAINDFVSSPVYFHGAGLSAGAQATWKIWHGFGLYGRFRSSLLSGHFRNFLTETNDNGAVTIVNVNETFRQMVPVLELGMGVAWQSDHVRVSAGYEMINWFNMVDSLDFPGSTNIGKVGRRTSDLSLEGLALRVAFLF
jgi:hypothetical protein